MPSKMLELATGGVLSQTEIYAIVHCSKRDVSVAVAKVGGSALAPPLLNICYRQPWPAIQSLRNVWD